MELIIVFSLPFFIGMFILIKFGKDNVGRIIGLLSLKPLLLLALIIFLDSFGSLDDAYAYLIFIPDLILTLIFGYFFRDLLNRERLTRFFFIGDVVRWLCLLVEFILPEPFPEPYFYTQLYVWFFFNTIFPSLYAIGGLVALQRCADSQKSVS